MEKNEIVLDPEVVLWGFEYRAAKGNGMVQIQRKGQGPLAKFRTIKRVRLDQWDQIHVPQLAQLSGADQAKHLYNLTKRIHY